MRYGGEAQVIAADDGRLVHIAVRGCEPGIPGELLERVFDPNGTH